MDAVEGFSMSISSETKCTECGKYLDTKFKFCPMCGGEITDVMRHGTVGDLLKKETVIPTLIYNKPTGKEFVEFKIKQLLDKDGNFRFQCTYMLYTPKLKNSYMLVNKDNYGIHKKYINRLDEYFKNQKSQPSYAYTPMRDGNDDIITHSKQAILQLMNVNHILLTNFTHLIDNTVENLLIILIENRINNPVVGQAFMVPDKNIKYHKNIYEDYWKNPDNYNRDSDVSVKYKFADVGMLPYEDLEDLKKSGHGVDLYDKEQKELDILLEKVHTDLYYSSGNRKIYMKEELESLLAKEIDLLGFKIIDHCTEFNIRHIRVYILNEEIDDLFDIGNIRIKMERIAGKFGLSRKKGLGKGMETRGVLDALLGL